MPQPIDDPNDRRMLLRYTGRCRLCGATLTAGTDAVYERNRRTVRCVECAPVVTPSADMSPVVNPAGAPSEDADVLRLRSPASSVIAEALRVQSSVPPRTGTQRFFGRSPLNVESRPWYLGALGELEVGRLLDQLGPEWFAFHAVPVGSAGSDVDHIVIGPGGVFTINSKFHEGGNVWVASRRLLVNGQRTDHLRNAEFEARRVAKLLTQAARRPVDVTPVIAIVAARRLTIRERPERVVVLAASQLPRWLQNRVAVLRVDEVAEVSRMAATPATWGQPNIPVADLAAFAELRSTVTAARNRRRSWALALMLSPLAMLATLTVGMLSLLR
ncbi:MAG: nuclease-related domain-containing protein [Microbacterium sp.]|uniref:nuclease-related domain-containing protein n=1 Tax=Microbacterium sp. TaxID=51671 RepID=UPI003F803868